MHIMRDTHSIFVRTSYVGLMLIVATLAVHIIEATLTSNLGEVSSGEEIMPLWSTSLLDIDAEGTRTLRYLGNGPTLLSSCHGNIQLYLDEYAYLSSDNFRTPMAPMRIPHSIIHVEYPVLEEAVVRLDDLVLLINGTVFIFSTTSQDYYRVHDLDDSTLNAFASSKFCCQHVLCQAWSDTIVALGSPQHGHFDSEFSFSCDVFILEHGEREFRKVQQLNDVSSWKVVMAVPMSPWRSVALLLVSMVEEGHAYFRYLATDEKGASNFAVRTLPFHLVDRRMKLAHLADRFGEFLLWGARDLLLSQTAGQTVLRLTGELDRHLQEEEFIRTLATGANREFAILTTEGNLLFGRCGLETRMTMLDISETIGPFSAIVFNNKSNIVAMYTKHYDLPSSNAESRDLVYLCSNIVYPAEVINSDPADRPACPFLMFARDFASDVFYIDVRNNLTLQVSYIPTAWTIINVMVFSSDPSILRINTSVVAGDPTGQGNHVTKVIAEISLAADHADSGISEYSQGAATVTVTTAEPSLTCNENPTVQAFVVAGCPPGKTIRQRKQVQRESCNYLRNYVYRFNRDEYDPTFMEGVNGIDADQVDLELQYDYGTHGCPDMSYFSDIFKPNFDLYIDDEFVEVIDADFALIEIHGVHNYDYRLNSKQAGCTRRPQSWVEMLQLQNDTQDPITAWTRVNYRNCIESGATPLEDKHGYQVMGSRTGNGIVWTQVNTIYVFNVTVLDPRYSYCHLRTQFAVEVYGALPPSAVSAIKVMLITCLLGFVGVAIVFIYYIVQIKDAEEEEDGQQKPHPPQFPH